MNIKELKEMINLMNEHGLAELEIEKDNFKIKLKKTSSGAIRQEVVHQHGPLPVLTPYALPLPGGAETQTAGAQAVDPNIHIVHSPMVGTFYASPAPDQPVYVTGGKRVKEGDVLCIIEAMKLMNEIKSEIGGTVLEILVKNGQPVEFDQPLFKVQKG